MSSQLQVRVLLVSRVHFCVDLTLVTPAVASQFFPIPEDSVASWKRPIRVLLDLAFRLISHQSTQ